MNRKTSIGRPHSKKRTIAKLRVRRLPSGKYTRSTNYYLRTWKQIGKRWLVITGHRLAAFDPGLQFEIPGEHCAYSLPLRVVRKILDSIEAAIGLKR